MRQSSSILLDLYMQKLDENLDLRLSETGKTKKIPSLYAKRGKIPKDAQKRMIAPRIMR